MCVAGADLENNLSARGGADPTMLKGQIRRGIEEYLLNATNEVSIQLPWLYMESDWS